MTEATQRVGTLLVLIYLITGSLYHLATFIQFPLLLPLPLPQLMYPDLFFPISLLACLVLWYDDLQYSVSSCFTAQGFHACMGAQLLSHIRLFATLCTVARQAPLSLGFSRQECWSGLPFPSSGDLPDPEIKPQSSVLQANSLQFKPPGKPIVIPYFYIFQVITMVNLIIRFAFISNAHFCSLQRLELFHLPTKLL